MSLAIVTTTNEGHVLAADSMETYKNSIGDVRNGSFSRMKIFQLNKDAGITVCGLSYLDGKSIGQHLAAYMREQSFEIMTLEQIASTLYDLFIGKYTAYIKEFEDKKADELRQFGCKDIQTESELERVTVRYRDLAGKEMKQDFYQPLLEFLLAGFNPDGTSGVYKITIPDAKDKGGIIQKLAPGHCGATWIGQTDVLVRLVRGWSPEIKRNKVIAELPQVKREDFLHALDDQEYIINWATMTVQDAINFSSLAIRTTENLQQITDGTYAAPGSSPGVGGPIDIAVITPEKGFFWVKRKTLKIGNTSVDME